MAILKFQRPNGTQDVVGKQIDKWHTVEDIVTSEAQVYGFSEIRIPTFESTSLFVRSVGDSTDVVQKEMYSVSAKGDAELSLRPEGTAGAMRAVIENGLLNESFPQKVYYLLSCFRHEKPQAGRLREFHQFGCEMVGSQDPRSDAELISLAKSIIDRTGIKGVELYINSIGCPNCRARFTEALKSYFADKQDSLCDNCKNRLETNPLRVIDCKEENCAKIAKDAPIILDYLCDECSEHFEKLKRCLDAMEIKYTVNPKIVRGLDYYTKTVFEFVTTDIGSQGTICGGGRYDGLIEQLGAKSTPAMGFAMGLERLILTMENQGVEFKNEPTCDLYIATLGEKAEIKAMQLCSQLRENGNMAECDIVGRGLKAQMKYADKIGAKFSMVIGDYELESSSARLRNMKNGELSEIKLDGSFAYNFESVLVSFLLGADDIFKQ